MPTLFSRQKLAVRTVDGWSVNGGEDRLGWVGKKRNALEGQLQIVYFNSPLGPASRPLIDISCCLGQTKKEEKFWYTPFPFSSMDVSARAVLFVREHRPPPSRLIHPA